MSTNTKPLAEWTLGDLKEHCTKEGDCKKPTVCRFFNPKEGGCSISQDTPNLWDLTEKPRFTADEVAFMRTIYVAAPNASFVREENGQLYLTDTEELDIRSLMPMELLPSLRPGQSIAASEVIGQ